MTAPRFIMIIDGRTEGNELRHEFRENGQRIKSGHAPSEAEIKRRFRAFVAVRSWEPA